MWYRHVDVGDLTAVAKYYLARMDIPMKLQMLKSVDWDMTISLMTFPKQK